MTTTAPAQTEPGVRPVSLCRCGDAALTHLHELMAAGMDQWNASLIAFGAEPAWDAPRQVWAAWCAREVRRIADQVLTRLGLA